MYGLGAVAAFLAIQSGFRTPYYYGSCFVLQLNVNQTAHAHLERNKKNETVMLNVCVSVCRCSKCWPSFIGLRR